MVYTKFTTSSVLYLLTLDLASSLGLDSRSRFLAGAVGRIKIPVCAFAVSGRPCRFSTACGYPEYTTKHDD